MDPPISGWAGHHIRPFAKTTVASPSDSVRTATRLAAKGSLRFFLGALAWRRARPPCRGDAAQWEPLFLPRVLLYGRAQPKRDAKRRVRMTKRPERPNRPALSLHVPEPAARPGDEVDFSYIDIPAAGS